MKISRRDSGDMMMGYKIGEIAKFFGIPAETLRFIEQNGLLHPSRQQDSAYREYSMPAFAELFEYNHGAYWFEKAPATYYLNVGTGESDPATYRDTAVATQWRKHVPFAALEMLAHQQPWRSECVFAVEKRYADILGRPGRMHDPALLLRAEHPHVLCHGANARGQNRCNPVTATGLLFGWRACLPRLSGQGQAAAGGFAALVRADALAGAQNSLPFFLLTL